MSRRRHFGSVRKLPSGRYQASYWHDGALHTGPSTFVSKADADAYLAGVQTDIRRSGWIDPRAGEEMLKHYADRWLNGRSMTLRPRTVELYRQLLDSHVLPTFGDKALSALRPSSVRDWHSRIATAHPSTAAKAYRLLSTICRAAVDDELILRSPCRVDGAGIERAPERPTVSLAEVEAITEAMPERLRLLVSIAMWCSLRRGELLALRRRDVDEMRGAIRVERAAQRVKGAPLSYGPPKTTAGVRTVHYPPIVAEDVREHLQRYVAPDPDGFLFTGEKGGPITADMLHKAWAKARGTIGRDDLHMHDLRHAGATLASIAGATTKELMTRLGHSSARAALIYQHATEDRDKAVAAALAELAKPAKVVPIDAARGQHFAHESRTEG